MSHAQPIEPVRLHDADFLLVREAKLLAQEGEDRAETLELIGAYLTDDFEDDFAEDVLAGVA